MIQKTYLKSKDLCKVKFTVEAPGAKTVSVMGLNNDWNTPIALGKKKAGVFSAEISLPKNSEHQFKYFIDEKTWSNEPEADSQVADTFGGENSLITL